MIEKPPGKRLWMTRYIGLKFKITSENSQFLWVFLLIWSLVESLHHQTQVLTDFQKTLTPLWSGSILKWKWSKLVTVISLLGAVWSTRFRSDDDKLAAKWKRTGAVLQHKNLRHHLHRNARHNGMKLILKEY